VDYTIIYTNEGGSGGPDPVLAGTFVSKCPSCGGDIIREAGGVGLPNGTVECVKRLVCDECRKEFKLVEVNDD